MKYDYRFLFRTVKSITGPLVLLKNFNTNEFSIYSSIYGPTPRALK